MGDKRVRGYRVTCRECGTVQEMPTARFAGPPNSKFEIEKITEKFTRAGWAIGHNAAHDRCPACCLKASKAPPTLKIVETKPMALAAVSPSPIGVDDALTISQELNEVYGGKTVGYSSGWSDARVAEKLNVPRAWVTDIRKKVFGADSLGDNDEIRKIEADARAALGEAGALLKRYEAEVSHIRAKIDKIEKTLVEINNAVRC